MKKGCALAVSLALISIGTLKMVVGEIVVGSKD